MGLSTIKSSHDIALGAVAALPQQISGATSNWDLCQELESESLGKRSWTWKPEKAMEMWGPEWKLRGEKDLLYFWVGAVTGPEQNCGCPAAGGIPPTCTGTKCFWDQGQSWEVPEGTQKECYSSSLKTSVTVTCAWLNNTNTVAPFAVSWNGDMFCCRGMICKSRTHVALQMVF